MTNTTDNQSPYRRGAENGITFGVYLTVMFFASVYSEKVQLLGLLTICMMLLVPFIIYRYLRRSYVTDHGCTLLSSLWMQGIMVFLCGSVLSASVQIVYLRWINPDFIINQLRSIIDIYSNSGVAQGEQMAELLQNLIDAKAVPSAISLVIEMIWLSVFTGSLLSVLVSLLVRARPVPPPRHPSEH